LREGFEHSPIASTRMVLLKPSPKNSRVGAALVRPRRVAVRKRPRTPSRASHAVLG
jgi:hypothetical protein